MIFTLQPGTAFQYPCRMKWMIKARNMSRWPTNNGATSCTPWRWKIIKSDLPLKSKYFQPLGKDWTTRSAMISLRLHTRRSTGLVSWRTEIRRVRKTPSINVLGVDAYCARRLECLSISINFISQTFSLGKDLASNLSGKSYKEA